MADERFDLIFRGDIVLGQPLGEVKQRLQQLLKTDAGKIEKLFSGRPVALKRGLDKATGEKYQKVLHKAGALVSLVPAQKASGHTDTARAPQPQRQPAGLSLAPVGGFLLNPTERPRLTPVSVDTSRLSLRPAEGDLLDAAERQRVEDALVRVPDFDLAEAGMDLLSEDERQGLPLMGVEPEDWGLAEAGSDLLSAEERGPEPEPPAVTADFDLAPPGSDMGQLKPQQHPVSPDISGLRLEE